MPDISYYVHFVVGTISWLLKKYDVTLLALSKMIKHNISPKNRIINYDLWVKNIIDNIIKKLSLNFSNVDVSIYEKKICILNTELYDTGGHTELLVRHLQLHSDEKTCVFLTNTFCRTQESINKLEKVKIIKELAENCYISNENTSLSNKIFEAYNYIIDNNITNVICNFHMQDAVSCAVLYLLKKYTNVEIDFWNHADHYYSLGTTYADRIYTRTKNGKACTPYLADNKKVVGGTFVLDSHINSYSKDDILQKRRELGIPDDAFVTLTGCAFYKVGSDYFKMMHKILEENKNIYHIFICSLRDRKKQKLRKKYKLNERFIIIDFVPNFDFYIQLSDLFVDSFPQGSALTLVDYIKHSKPVVIKINKKEPIKSFEEYLYPDYEYAYETPKGMIEGVTKLANDKNLYKKMQIKVHEYFEKTYLG